MIARLTLRIGLLLAIGAVIATVFVMVVRPAYLDWGATAIERTRTLPGDTIVPNPAAQNTRAITIHAPASKVWPWLAQLGQDRGGFYSFDLLENLVGCAMPTTDVLRPDKQAWQVGDKLWMYPKHSAGGAGFATLRVLEPGRAMGFATRMFGTTLDQPENGSWTFVLEPIDQVTTRLLIRGRGAARPSLLGISFDRGVFEPAHYAMERRMMLGLRDLAETGSRNRLVNHVHVLLWMVALGMFLGAAFQVLSRRDWRRPLLALVTAAAVFQILTLLQPSPVAGLALVIVLAFALRRSPIAPVQAGQDQRPAAVDHPVAGQVSAEAARR